MSRNLYDYEDEKYFNGLKVGKIKRHQDIVNSKDEKMIRFFFEVEEQSLIWTSVPKLSEKTNFGKLVVAVFGEIPVKTFDITSLYGKKVVLEIDSSTVKNGVRYNNIKKVSPFESLEEDTDTNDLE